MMKPSLFFWVLAVGVPFAFADDFSALELWGKYEVEVRDGLIAKEKARSQLPSVMKAIEQHCKKLSFEKDQKWQFPLEGYGTESIGGRRGNGFQPDIVYGTSPIKGYDFFDGDRHGGHPAHDIFIRDRNQDNLDDRTGHNVNVVSMVDSLVLSVHDDWNSKSSLRGGNVVWLYNSELKLLFYYAHLDRIFVKPGQFVRKGHILATVGRTGLSAHKKRSPTHIHLMALRYENQSLLSYDYYADLNRSTASHSRRSARGDRMQHD